VSTPTLIGVAAPRGAYTARRLHHGDHPDTLVPLLRRVWTDTFARDTAAMATALLAHDWSELATSGKPSRLGRQPSVPGLGWPAPTSEPTARHGSLNEDLDGSLEWLYLLHTEHRTVVVYIWAGRAARMGAGRRHRVILRRCDGSGTPSERATRGYERMTRCGRNSDAALRRRRTAFRGLSGPGSTVPHATSRSRRHGLAWRLHRDHGIGTRTPRHLPGSR
jgi:hypothetical protein